MPQPAPDPLAHLLGDSTLADAVGRARRAAWSVHRLPVNLRKGDITSAEALLRGARAAAVITLRGTLPAAGTDSGGAPAPAAGGAGDALQRAAVDVYSLLAEGVREKTVATFRRAPGQLLAQLAVRAGAAPVPDCDPQRLAVLLRLCTNPHAHDVLLPVIVGGELACLAPFGPATTLVALAATRVAACATGFDPQSLLVSENQLLRQHDRYRQLAENFASGTAQTTAYLCFHLNAYTASADEAAGIARSAGSK
ncbi:oxidoreductase [Corynebacterium mendelii]|uniref:Oxidoreductase n=1 Tax=Corynebacterium mendelii TaxID=2765362 RepID=A0A939E1F9_9CORY|nr:oxidoreductase [Corynebacterium mendelii]MBN9643782.1 oxidoreductase [Corynebacterium mendelii]